MAALSREEICKAASKKLAGATPRSVNAVVGFDGFVDEIIEVVEKRQNAESYEKFKTIHDYGSKVVAAAGESTNFELVVTQQKLGGNGPIMANALAAIGLAVTYVGNLGFPAIHPVFQEMTGRADVHSIAEPASTLALEFNDGKLMLGKHAAVKDVTWDNIVNRVGREKLTGFVDRAQLIGMVNWTMLPHMNEIWSKLQNEVLTKLPRGGRKIFIDLADPEKRTVEDLRAGLAMVQNLQEHAHVILGLNLKEAVQVNEALGLAKRPNAEAAIEEMARDIRAKLKIGTVVIHPRKGAAAANEQESARFQGPFIEHPKISTGAGDHFNAGFVAAQLLGLSLAESLCMGTATSGYYVRTAISPSAAQLAEFMASLPAGQA